jgi:hypothetical protein
LWQELYRHRETSFEDNRQVIDNPSGIPRSRNGNLCRAFQAGKLEDPSCLDDLPFVYSISRYELFCWTANNYEIAVIHVDEDVSRLNAANKHFNVMHVTLTLVDLKGQPRSSRRNVQNEPLLYHNIQQPSIPSRH